VNDGSGIHPPCVSILFQSVELLSSQGINGRPKASIVRHEPQSGFVIKIARIQGKSSNSISDKRRPDICAALLRRAVRLVVNVFMNTEHQA
jgi:hypothetical protein